MKHQKVAVVMGGLSAEREVSLASGAAVARGLEDAGHTVTRIDATRELDRQLREASCHGRWGEDGTVQGMLEVMGIPYTGSPVLASALAMDKVRTREILRASGIPVAPGAVLTREDGVPPRPDPDLPVVVKPASEGSSFGITIVRERAAFPAALEEAWSCSSRALIEKYVPGMEVNVAVMDGEVLGSVEIEAHAEFYDYDAKYAPGGSTHHIPPRLPAETIALTQGLGERSFAAIGCAGAARIDLIVPENGEPVVLEVNTIPGMTTTSLLPEIAQATGISFAELVSRLAEGARLHT